MELEMCGRNGRTVEARETQNSMLSSVEVRRLNIAIQGQSNGSMEITKEDLALI